MSELIDIETNRTYNSIPKIGRVLFWSPHFQELVFQRRLDCGLGSQLHRVGTEQRGTAAAGAAAGAVAAASSAASATSSAASATSSAARI